MTLKNDNGVERNFKLLLEVQKNSKKYLVYKNTYNNYIYGGRVVKKSLKPLNDKEFDYLNGILEKMQGMIV